MQPGEQCIWVVVEERVLGCLYLYKVEIQLLIPNYLVYVLVLNADDN
jgi:hypothetical protein